MLKFQLARGKKKLAIYKHGWDETLTPDLQISSPAS